MPAGFFNKTPSGLCTDERARPLAAKMPVRIRQLHCRLRLSLFVSAKPLAAKIINSNSFNFSIYGQRSEA